jgi:glycerol-3-phosphate O-acyltransferase
LLLKDELSTTIIHAGNQRVAIMNLRLAIFLLPLASAWVAGPSAAQAVVRKSALAVSLEVEDPAVVKLQPEFAAAYEGIKQKLTASMPEALQQGKMLPLLLHFGAEYLGASQDAYQAGSTETCAPGEAARRYLTGVQYGLKYGINPETKYTFDVSHVALRGNPETENGNDVDYYAFGCNFFGPCMDMDKSIILGMDHLNRIAKQIEAGENVVLLANHQSEADPQVVSKCFEKAGYGKLAADMIYVAGHKVTTDPLAIPFSMGRNLICIHSKKHIDADPEAKPMKQRQNIKAMNSLLKSLKQGGSIIWVAPSGGRDRRNVETGDVPIAPFDSKTIDIFRLYGNKSKVKTHYYPFAMVSYDLCPPPDFIEASVGEQRNVRFVPVGIAVGDELESTGGLEGRHEFCDQAQMQCDQDYRELLKQLSNE